MRRLPHRYPFLLVDRVLECVSGQAHPRAQERHHQRAVLSRPLSASAGDAGRDDSRGAGADRRHPGVRHRRRVPGRARQLYFVGIDKARFRRPVEPGDQLILKATLERSIRGIWKFSTIAEVNGEEAASAEMMVAPGETKRSARPLSMAIHPTALIDRQRAARAGRAGRRVHGDRRRRRRSARGTWIGPHVVIDGPTTIGATTRSSSSRPSAPRRRTSNTTTSRRGWKSAIATCFARTAPSIAAPPRISWSRASAATICSWPARTSAHDCVIGSHCVLANYATLGGHVHMGDWVHMGGFSGMHQFCQVGAHAFIANNTAVTRDVPPFVMAVGRPAEPHSVNAEGLKRRGYSRRADPQHPRRLSHPVSLAAEARRGHRADRAARAGAAGVAAAGRVPQRLHAAA